MQGISRYTSCMEIGRSACPLLTLGYIAAHTEQLFETNGLHVAPVSGLWLALHRAFLASSSLGATRILNFNA